MANLNNGVTKILVTEVRPYGRGYSEFRNLLCPAPRTGALSDDARQTDVRHREHCHTTDTYPHIFTRFHNRNTIVTLGSSKFPSDCNWTAQLPLYDLPCDRMALKKFTY